MSAEAGVLLVAVPRCHVFGAVAEQAAEVSHFLPEGGGRGAGIMRRLKQQRVPALNADVFVAAVAIGEFLVVMLAEKAGQRMPDPCDREIFAEIRRPAPAAPMAGGVLEHVVVDMVPPQRAREFGQ